MATLVTGLGVAAPAAAVAAPRHAAGQETAADVASCSALLISASTWTGGFVGNVRVTNTSTVPITWRVTINFPGATIIPPPGYIIVQSGTSWLIYPPPPPSWGGTLAPGASAYFGFSATTSGGMVIMPILTCTATPV